MKHFLIIIFLMITGLLYSAEVNWNIRLVGSDILGGTCEVKDKDYGVRSYLDRQGSTRGYLRLGVEDKVGGGYYQGFRYVCRVRITPYVDNQAQSSFTQDLEIDYGQNGVQLNVGKLDYFLPDIHSFTVSVEQVTVYDLGGLVQNYVPSNVYLECGFESERYYPLSMNIPLQSVHYLGYNTQGVSSILSQTSITNSVDEISFSWGIIEGAEEYDLEWTWVDDYGDVSGVYLPKESISLTETEFITNSTRLRLKGNSYRLSHSFTHGYIVWRVRSVGRFTDTQEHLDQLKFGPWSSGTNLKSTVSSWGVLGLSILAVTESYEGKKNWQYTASYAEDGKHKEIMQYYDGSLRSRQVLTKTNSNNKTIIGETIYDHQGRGAIQVLPSPQSTMSLAYQPLYNLNPQGLPYNYENFEYVSTNTTGCSYTTSDPLSQSTGSGLYYSTQGHLSDENWQQYVPESWGYGYSQVQYTPDNTGRVSRQGGVGREHQIGSGHETVYYYSQPSQEELNRLFGYKVGYMNRYKKNSVVDANGQTSVSYLDASGKVVATSLSGENTTGLSTLSSTGKTEQSIPTDLLGKLTSGAVDNDKDNNELISTGRFGDLSDGLQLSKEMVVTQEGYYDFDYLMTSLSYEEAGCESTPISYPYKYDLRIRVLDQCGTELFSDSQEMLSGTYHKTSSTPGVLLKPGTYTVYKLLQVNKDSYEDYLASYLDPTQNKCVSEEESFKEPVENSCNESCSKCVTDLGTRESYISLRLEEERTTRDVSETEASSLSLTFGKEYDDKKLACMEPCLPVTECDAYYDQLLGDMRPGQQYGSDEITPDGVVSDELSIYNENNNLPKNVSLSTGKFSWRNGVYYDENGDLSKIILTDNGIGGYNPEPRSGVVVQTSSEGDKWIYPNDLKNVSDFFNNFQDQWAESLVSYHPEYSLYVYSKEICSKEVSVLGQEAGQSVTTKLSSSYFDAHLSDNISSFEDAMGVVNANNPAKEMYSIETVITGTPSQTDYIDHYYTYTYLSTSNPDIVSGAPIYNIDPYFSNNYSVHEYQINGVRVPLHTLKRNLMEEALTNYKGQGVSMIDYAISMVLTPYEQTNQPIHTWNDLLLIYTQSDFGLVSQDQLNQIWIQYKSLYLSEKQKINQLMMDYYGFAQTPGIYNGAIGTKGLGLGIASYYQNSQYLNDIFGYIVQLWGGVSPVFRFMHTPNELATSKYDDKEIRISRVESLQNTEDENLQLIDLQAKSEYAYWEKTGQCPLAHDLETFLNQLAIDGRFTSNSIGINSIVTFTPLLQRSFSINESANAHYSGNIQSTQNLELTVTVNDGQSTTSQAIGTLVLPSMFSWNNYEQTWKIYGVHDLITNANSSENKVILLIGEAGNLPKEYVCSVLTSLDLNGCSSHYQSDNSYSPDCTKREDFGKSLFNLIQDLITQQELQSQTDFSLSTLPSYSTGVLKKYFGDNALWRTGHIVGNNGSVNVLLDLSDLVSRIGNQGLLLSSLMILPNNKSFSLTYFQATTGTTIEFKDEISGFKYYENGSLKTIDFRCDFPETNCQEKFVYNLQMMLNDAISNYEVAGDFEGYTSTNIRDLGFYFKRDINTSKLNVAGVDLNSSPSQTTSVSNGVTYKHATNKYAISFNNIVLNCTGYQRYFEMPESIATECLYTCGITLELPRDPTTLSQLQLETSWVITELKEINKYNFIGKINGKYDILVHVGCDYECPVETCKPERELPVSCDDEYIYYQSVSSVVSGYPTKNYDGIDFTKRYSPSEASSMTLPLVQIGSYYYPYLPGIENIGGHRILSKDEFCNYRLGYISKAYVYYIWRLGVTSESEYYMDISEFGNTPIGYSNDKLITAIDYYYDYLNTGSGTKLSWNAWINGIYLVEHKVCPSIVPDPNLPDLPAITYPCNEWEDNVSIVDAKSQYSIYLDRVEESFMKQYVESAISSVVEEFTEQHTEHNNHYTLYYYDRAGNLMRTVPPSGVDVLPLDVSSNKTLNTKRTDSSLELEDRANMLTPSHSMYTDYRYNSLNQLIYQNTPDGGESWFAYDGLGRLIASQNNKQRNNTEYREYFGPSSVWTQDGFLFGYQKEPVSAPQFSYTYYDGLGRVEEVGVFTDYNNLLTINEYGRLVYKSSSQEVVGMDANGVPVLDWLNRGDFVEQTKAHLHNPDGSNLGWYNQLFGSYDVTYTYSRSRRSEVTRTLYDELKTSSGGNIYYKQDLNHLQSLVSGVYINEGKGNTRNRIVGVFYQESYKQDLNEYDRGRFYNYDVHGNVSEMLEVNHDMSLLGFGQTGKHYMYHYDLISGKVNEVFYQKGKDDQFIHRYQYDADNRLTIAETSRDGIYYEKDAKYFYYDHGPLARVEIGERKVQAEDYAYTLHGWLKTVNGEEVSSTTRSMGGDGIGVKNSPTGMNQEVGRDVYGYSLNYYTGDYSSSNMNMLPYSEQDRIESVQQSVGGKNLYNGNIRSMITALSNTDEINLTTHQTIYNYDQLNRIVSMSGYNRTLTNLSQRTPSGYGSNYSYDANGNIHSLSNDIAVSPTTTSTTNMDKLRYYYYNKDNTIYEYNSQEDGLTQNDASSLNLQRTNKLAHVKELSSNTTNYGDVKNQVDGNYQYDAIGQLTSDLSEGILEINWTVTNKVKSIKYGSIVDYEKVYNGREIAFEYDAMGHRVSKLEKTATGEEKKTLYSLDAQGNTMATYHYTKSSTGLESLSMGEWTIYGSKRIGIEQGSGVEFNPIKKINNTYVGNNIWDEAEWEEIPVEVYPPWQIGTWDEPNQVIGQKYEHSEGDKRYELANHLGNVLNVVTDRKLPVDIPLTANSPQGDGIVDYFTADVVSYSDYLPFGQVMPNRHGYIGAKYHYGFQDQEVDDELKGEDNSVNYKYRMHDPRIGRFFAIDPLASKYPFYSPYQFSGNRLIDAIELEGKEPKGVVKKIITYQNFTMQPEKDAPPSEKPQVVTMKIVEYKFTQSAAHLLSLVSGISETDISNAEIRNGSGTKMPVYSIKNGGGAITYPDITGGGLNINYTENYFDPGPGAEFANKNYDYSKNTFEWLELSSHEVCHKKDINELGNIVTYFTVFAAGYLKAKGHDEYWREKRADKGQNEFLKFNDFVDSKYGFGKLTELFENESISENDKIKKIDEWHREYKKSQKKK